MSEAIEVGVYEPRTVRGWWRKDRLCFSVAENREERVYNLRTVREWRNLCLSVPEAIEAMLRTPGAAAGQQFITCLPARLPQSVAHPISFSALQRAIPSECTE